MPRINRPYERIKMNVINRSRRSEHPRLIVLHSTEGHNRTGVGDLRDLGNYFDNPSVQASSHVGVDAEGHSAKYVDDGEKAWTCAGFNSASLNILSYPSNQTGTWAKGNCACGSSGSH